MQANRQKTKLKQMEIEDSGNENQYTVYVVRRGINEINPGYSLSVEVDSDISSHTNQYPLYKIKGKGVHKSVNLDKFDTSEQLVSELLSDPNKYRVILDNQGQVYSTLFDRLGIDWVHRSNA